MLRLILPLTAAGAVLVVATIFQGNWSERWNEAALSAELDAAAKKVENVPMFVGDWKGTDQKVDPAQLQAAHVRAHQSRDYFNVKNRAEQIGYFLVCGKPRHVAIHTPDDCYVAAGFEMLGKPETVTIEVGKEQVKFFTTLFRKVQGSDVQTLRVFWAWNDGKGWEAPMFPRVRYGVGASLYKMYCILPTADDKKIDDQHPCVKFVKAMLPEIDHALFGKALPTPPPVTPTTTTPETPAAPAPAAGVGG